MAQINAKRCRVYFRNFERALQILKSGIRSYNTETDDNIWLTCCAQQNMLEDVDGLSKSRNNGVRSHWELESGAFGADKIPLPIQRLIDPSGTEEFDRSRFGNQRPPTLVSDNEQGDNDDDGNRSYRRNRRRNGNHNNATASCRMHRGRTESGMAMNKLNFFQFRLHLIDNFNIRFHNINVQWPRRLAHLSPRHVPPVLIVAA